MVRSLDRRRFLRGLAGSLAAASALGRAAPGTRRRPNVLFILADDLGYGDLSCYGRPDYRTPILDDLAHQGLRFTSAYAAAPVCTPTRCAFHTGRYPQRLEVGLQEPLTRGSKPGLGLPPRHPTIATLLRKDGYDTALIGKWHLGWGREQGPNRHGYDYFLGSLSGATDYFTHESADAPGGGDLWEDTTRIQRPGYLTTLFSDAAIEYVSRPRSRPFYLSLHYNAPHSPWEGPGDPAIRHDEHGLGPMVLGGSLRTYAAMVREMDAGIGRVLEALRRTHRESETLVIFTSDNGGERYSYHWPFSFQKFYLHEGGIRVPAIVRWPGAVPAGSTTEQAAITMDWTATILAAAGTPADRGYPLDGEDLLPVCTQRRPVHDRALFWRARGREAARIGGWKYLQDSGVESLFDLANDPGEKNDLKQKQPTLFARLKQQYQAWNAGMLPPARG